LNIDNSLNNVKDSEININISNINPNELILHLNIEKFKLLKIQNNNDLKKLAETFYLVNQNKTLLQKVVVNNIDLINLNKLEESIEQINNMEMNSLIWLLGIGGIGKSTFLHRLMYEFAKLNKEIFYLDLSDYQELSNEFLIKIFSYIKSYTNEAYIFIDNPYSNKNTFTKFIDNITLQSYNFKIIVAERINRKENLEQEFIPIHIPNTFNDPILYSHTNNFKNNIYTNFCKNILKLDSNNKNVSNIINSISKSQVNIVEGIYTLQIELKENLTSSCYEFDWIEFKKISEKNFISYAESYFYVALLYLISIKTPLIFLQKILEVKNNNDTNYFIEYFNNKEILEPLICTKIQKGLEDSYYFNTKHEIVSELYFKLTKSKKINFNRTMAQLLLKIYSIDILLFEKIITNLSSNYNGKVYFDLYEIINYLKDEKIIYSNNIKVLFDISLLSYYEGKQKIKQLLEYSEKISKKYTDNNEINNLLLKYKIQYTNYQKIDNHKYMQRNNFDDFSDNENKINKSSDDWEEIEFYFNNKLYGKVVENINLLFENKKFDFQQQSIKKFLKFYQAYIKSKEFNKVEDLLNKILTTDNSNVHLVTILANVYKYQYRYEDAKNLLEELLNTNSKNIEVILELAKIYQLQNRYDEAENILLESLRIDNKQLHPRTELAKVYQTQKKYDDAERVLLESLKIDKNNLQARTELARVYQTQKKYNDAEKVLLDSIKLNSLDLTSRSELSKVYQQMQKYKNAIDILESNIKIDKNDLYSRAELAKVYQTQKKYDDAEKVLSDLLKIDKNNLQARTELAKVYQIQKKYDDAKKVLLECIELDPNGLHPRVELAKLYQIKKKYDDAEKVLLECIELEPNG
jgi:tetratricopeptide (TPR) repeat protein